MATRSIAVTKTQSILDELERVHQRISHRAHELFRANGTLSDALENWVTAERELLWLPAVELVQQDGRFEVRAALAGVNSAALDVRVTPDELLIQSSEVHGHRANGATVHRCEFSCGELFCSVRFPERVEPTGVTADYRDGMLRVVAPLATSPRKKTAGKRGRK